jgi:hypothetical protein
MATGIIYIFMLANKSIISHTLASLTKSLSIFLLHGLNFSNAKNLNVASLISHKSCHSSQKHICRRILTCLIMQKADLTVL